MARSCADWYRLLEIAALAGTLIVDEEGVYDPNHYNDLLLPGLKGTLSEAELHFLKQRMIGGRRNKARRGGWAGANPVYTQEVETFPQRAWRPSLAPEDILSICMYIESTIFFSACMLES